MRPGWTSQWALRCAWMCVVGRVWWLVSGLTSRYLLTYRKGGTFAAWPQRADLRNMPSLRPAFYFFASMLLLLDFCSTCLHWRQTSDVPFPMRKALNHASAKGVTGVSRGEKSQFLQRCLIWMSRDYSPNWREAGTPKWWNTDIFPQMRTHTCFDSMKASAIL